MPGALSLLGLVGVDLGISFAPMFQLVLLSGSHLWFISVLILDSHVSYDDTMIRSPPRRQNYLKMFMNRNRIWDRGWVLVRPVWAPSGLLQTVPMWCFYCGLFSLGKLFCLYLTLTLGSPLVIYLMSSWCLCSVPIWCLGQKCQFSTVLLIYGMGLKVDERQWSGTVTIKFFIKQTLKLRTVSCI